MNKKIDFPDMLGIGQFVSLLSDDLNDLTSKISSILCFIEDTFPEDSKMKLIVSLMDMIYAKMCDMQRNSEDWHKEFPNMPIDQWKIFSERFEKFKDTLSDIKTNP